MATIARPVKMGLQGGTYRLRFDRMAGWLMLLSALIWAALLVRGLIFARWLAGAEVITGDGALLALEHGLYGLSAQFGQGGIILALFAFAGLDAALGAALLRNAAAARVVTFLRIAAGLGLCVAYYLFTHDFGSAIAIAALYGLTFAFLTRNPGFMLAYPGMMFLGVFFVVPLMSVVAYSLGQGTALGTVDLSAPSLENYARILTPVGKSGLIYLNIIGRTLWIALLNTIICLIIAYPFAFWMARQPERWRNVLMMAVMIPFWTNLLIRTYAWVIILRKDGLLNNFLIDVLGVIDKPLELTNTPGALLLGLVYGYLPYMILPLYTAVERLDKRYLEASSDLYARPWQSFLRVMLPLTMPGIVAGSILVFIPSVGTYVVTNVLGGGKYFMIGNLLEQQFMSSNGDKSFGAAFGVVLTVLMLMATLVYFRLGRRGEAFT